MIRKALKISGGLIGTVAVAKAAYITSNEDWDIVYYRTQKYLSNKSKTKITNKKKVVVLGSGWGALSFIQQLDRGT